MKKIYRYSQLRQVIGKRVNCRDLLKYGIPYHAFSGMFFPDDQDRMDLLFEVVKAYPELHIVSNMKNRHMLNRYEPGAKWYALYLGNADRDIEINNEVEWDDYTDQQKRVIKNMEEKMTKTTFEWLNPTDPVMQAHMQWFWDDMTKPKKSN